MKRIFLCLIIMSFFITGCFSKKGKSYIELDYIAYQEKIEKKEDFILYIGSADCTHCKSFKPTLESVIQEYDLEIYYIDLLKLSKEQYRTIWDGASLEGTPTIVFVKKGDIKLFPRIGGAVPKDVLIEQLQSAGYIK